jgi:hypothetical protein
MVRFCKCLWICLFVFAGAASATTLSELKMSILEYRASQKLLSPDPMPSGVFYDLVAPLSGIENFNGTNNAATIDARTWIQLSHELRRASLFDSKIPSHEILRQREQLAHKQETYPLLALLFDYQRIRADFDQDKVITFDEEKVKGIDHAALETDQVAALTSLNEWTYHGSDVTFSLSENDVYSNVGELAEIEIDFDDGAGFRAVKLNQDIEVSYITTGAKSIHSRFTARNGRVFDSRTRFEVRSLDAPPPSETWNLTASHSTGGPAATGEAYILYAPGHAQVTRPVVLVEGLDLTNTLNWNELYDLMNQQMLIETLLQTGFDAVVLNYDNSTITVQDNAFLVQELIEELNSATGAVYPLVMVGTSLGGVTTRYALTYMENHNLPHNVSTFISVDSPQNGANIPIGIQYWADFFSGESTDAAEARDALLTPAPRQLLLYHFSSSSSGTALPDPMQAALQNELASIGDYPSIPRIVSVINGSGTQQNSGFLPGAQLILWSYDSFLVDIRGNVWAVSNTVNTRVLQGEINLIWPLPDELRNVFIQPCLPWDNAPGGTTPTMAELAAVQAPYGDIVALHDAHCFIPSISALDLNVADPFFNVTGAENLLDLTPFDQIYYPVANQEHVEITPENANWYLTEIIGPLEQPYLTISFASDSLSLRWTSVLGATNYRVYQSPESGNWPPTYVSTSSTNLNLPVSGDIGFFQVIAERN